MLGDYLHCADCRLTVHAGMMDTIAGFCPRCAGLLAARPRRMFRSELDDDVRLHRRRPRQLADTLAPPPAPASTPIYEPMLCV